MTTHARAIGQSLLWAHLAIGVGCGTGGGPAGPPEEIVKVPGQGTVVVYVEARKRTAAPLLRTFEEQTGIHVDATYRETLGDRFLPTLRENAAKGKIDLFWGESPLSACEIVDADLAVPFRPIGARPVPEQYRDRQFRWIGFAANPRVIIYNSARLKPEEAPTGTADLTRAPWAGRGAVPRIASGPAAFHAAALFSLWGPERARSYLDALRADGTRIVDDDPSALRLVSSGEASWALIGLDEAIGAKREAAPINILFPDRFGQGAVVPPQVAVLLRGAPDAAQAKCLYGYLFATEGAWLLGQNDYALITFLPDAPKPGWVPGLASLNVARVDPLETWKVYRERASFFASWGPAAAPVTVPR